MPEEEIPVNAEEEKLNTAEECSQDDATIQTGEEETGEQEIKKSKKEKPAVDDILKNFDAHPIEAPKKKKKIIFVSNPHNSNIPGQRQGNNDRRSGQGNRPSNGNRQNQNPGRQQQETRHKIIRPLTAPSMPETTQVDKMQEGWRAKGWRQKMPRQPRQRFLWKTQKSRRLFRRM